MDLHWTHADQANGFPRLRATLATCPVPELQRAYLEGTRDSRNAMFGHNAAVLQREVARELLARGETTIPNLFGPLAIHVR